MARLHLSVLEEPRWRALQVPLIPGDPGNKGLPDSKSSQTRTGALHWRRPNPPALSCQPGQAPPLTSSMARGGGSPWGPGSHTCIMETTQKRTSLLPAAEEEAERPDARRHGGSPRSTVSSWLGGGGREGTGLQGQQRAQSGAGWVEARGTPPSSTICPCRGPSCGPGRRVDK